MSNTIKNYVDCRMVKIPGGEIDLRDDRIKSKWKVEIKPFLLAQYPVTMEVYFAITKQLPFSFDGDERPAVNISWNDAITFCNLLSKNTELNIVT